MNERIKELMADDQAMAATPHTELIAELMNPNNPKNEREHAAVREIERLREALAQPEQDNTYTYASSLAKKNLAETLHKRIP